MPAHTPSPSPSSTLFYAKIAQGRKAGRASKPSLPSPPPPPPTPLVQGLVLPLLQNDPLQGAYVKYLPYPFHS